MTLANLSAQAYDDSVAVGYMAPGAQINHYAAPRPPVRWPHQVGVLPRRADCFLENRSALTQLEQAASQHSTVVLCQVLAGMGGVGKTQLAAHHARKVLAQGEVDLLVWITATNRAAVLSAYAQAAIELQLPGADPADPEQAAQAFQAWLEPKRGSHGRRWLVVLDDLSNPADMRGLWPPASSRGRTLVTTRRREAALTGPDRHLVPVGLFTESEAVAYLVTALSSRGRTEPTDQLASLAADLGHLPLALAQATAYLINDGLDCATYRTLLADHSQAFTDLLPDPSGLPDDQAATVAAAWSLSIELAAQLPPHGLAPPMLQLASVLDPNGIPDIVLTSPPVLTYLSESSMSTVEQTQAATARDAVRVLRTLHRFSLIDHTPTSPHQAVRIHQLIQRATRDALSPDQRDRLVHAAADALTSAWPDIERDIALAQALRANATALITCSEPALYQPEAHEVLYRTGRSLGQAGQVTAARDYYKHLTDTATSLLGLDHHDTVVSRSNLARWIGEAGDAAGAVTAYAELLAHLVLWVGPDHPETLATASNLARWVGEAGDAPGAATRFAGLVPNLMRVLGPDHPDTLTTRNDLAYWRGEAGDAAGAATAFAELLTDRLRVLGPDHPDTLTNRNNLAIWRGEAGDAAGAATAFAELLTDRLRVYGPDHPETLTTRNNLAYWRGMAGDAASAITTLTELLPDRLRVLGPDHPDTLDTRCDLAYWRGEAGDAAGAVTAYAELLADLVRVLGPDHPTTVTNRYNHARWIGEAGDAAGAVTAYAELLADLVRVRGPDNPATLNIRYSLAYWWGEVGDAAGASAAYAELLEHAVRMLGPYHPNTLTIRYNLGIWRGRAGNMAARQSTDP